MSLCENYLICILMNINLKVKKSWKNMVYTYSIICTWAVDKHGTLMWNQMNAMAMFYHPYTYNICI